jgi:hypothetical protein
MALALLMLPRNLLAQRLGLQAMALAILLHHCIVLLGSQLGRLHYCREGLLGRHHAAFAESRHGSRSRQVADGYSDGDSGGCSERRGGHGDGDGRGDWRGDGGCGDGNGWRVWQHGACRPMIPRSGESNDTSTIR